MSIDKIMAMLTDDKFWRKVHNGVSVIIAILVFSKK